MPALHGLLGRDACNNAGLAGRAQGREARCVRCAPGRGAPPVQNWAINKVIMFAGYRLPWLAERVVRALGRKLMASRVQSLVRGRGSCPAVALCCPCCALLRMGCAPAAPRAAPASRAEGWPAGVVGGLFLGVFSLAPLGLCSAAMLVAFPGCQK
jgi:hypothetical protein